jgi:hypothetical protein
MPSRKRRGSFCMSGSLREIDKPCAFQISRRTAASVSAKVGCCLQHQAAVQTAQRVRGTSWLANNATRKNSPHLAFHRLRRRNLGQLRPAALRPRDWQHHRQRQPAQAAGLDEEAARGAHRVAVDAAVADVGPPASLDAVVGDDHHLAFGQQHLKQVPQQLARQRAAIPARLTQHLVVAAEARPIRQPYGGIPSAMPMEPWPPPPITRSAALTVRCPGASIAPATSTSTRGQTEAVKPSRNGTNQAASNGGTGTAGSEQAGGGEDPVSSAGNARDAAAAIHTAVHPPWRRATTIRVIVMSA